MSVCAWRSFAGQMKNRDVLGTCDVLGVRGQGAG